MKKILIVEDDAKVAKALRIRMNSAGYATDLAPDAIQGVSRAAAFQPDLVLLDIHLPGGNGIDLARQLRLRLPVATPMIFLTASKRADLVEQAAAVAGPVWYLEKPYQPANLMAIVERSLRAA